LWVDFSNLQVALKNATRDELMEIKSIVDFKLKNERLSDIVEVEEVESLE